MSVPREVIMKDGTANPWILCKGCGCESYYRPTCHQCNRDNLMDLVKDLAAGDFIVRSPNDNLVVLSDFLFKGKTFPNPTTSLPEQLTYNPPMSVEALLSGGPSLAGWSVTSGMMECPYRGQLLANNVRPRVDWALGDELNRLGYGSLIHALLAVRWCYGMDWVFNLLNSPGYADLHPADKLKAEVALKTYDYTWPRETEPFAVLGVECEVFTEIAPGVISSVRYDAVIKPFKTDPNTGQYIPELEDHVLSLERKTTATGGESTMTGYTGQFYTQVSNWNANAALVAKYGPMVGVWGDLITKHKVPRAERIGPRYISKFQQDFAQRYLAYKAQIRYPVDAQGRLPQMLNACIGRYGLCQYFSLCHDNSVNSYEVTQA